jgi:hypothetical protein
MPSLPWSSATTGSSVGLVHLVPPDHPDRAEPAERGQGAEVSSALKRT